MPVAEFDPTIVTSLLPDDWKLVPKVVPHGEGIALLGAFIAAVAPAAALGAVAGSMMGELSPKQARYAKMGAMAGVCTVAAVMAIIAWREDR